jgi:hypothetical protein
VPAIANIIADICGTVSASAIIYLIIQSLMIRHKTMNKLKTISIKGKPYVTVAERIKEFNNLYPNGRITTEIILSDENTVTMKATVTPDVKNPDRIFTGFSHEDKRNTMSMVNKTSHIENAETSCIGRALGIMGIGIIDSIASADEVTKAINAEKRIAGETVQVSDTLQVEIPMCSVCGLAMFKNSRGYWSCPQWWAHKTANLPSKPVFKKDILPEIDIDKDNPGF